MEDDVTWFDKTAPPPAFPVGLSDRAEMMQHKPEAQAKGHGILRLRFRPVCCRIVHGHLASAGGVSSLLCNGFAKTCARPWESQAPHGPTCACSFLPNTTTPSATCINSLPQPF